MPIDVDSPYAHYKALFTEMVSIRTQRNTIPLIIFCRIVEFLGLFRFFTEAVKTFALNKIYQRFSFSEQVLHAISLMFYAVDIVMRLCIGSLFRFVISYVLLLIPLVVLFVPFYFRNHIVSRRIMLVVMWLCYFNATIFANFHMYSIAVINRTPDVSFLFTLLLYFPTASAVCVYSIYSHIFFIPALTPRTGYLPTYPLYPIALDLALYTGSLLTGIVGEYAQLSAATGICVSCLLLVIMIIPPAIYGNIAQSTVLFIIVVMHLFLGIFVLITFYLKESLWTLVPLLLFMVLVTSAVVVPLVVSYIRARNIISVFKRADVIERIASYLTEFARMNSFQSESHGSSTSPPSHDGVTMNDGASDDLFELMGIHHQLEGPKESIFSQKKLLSIAYTIYDRLHTVGVPVSPELNIQQLLGHAHILSGQNAHYDPVVQPPFTHEECLHILLNNKINSCCILSAVQLLVHALNTFGDRSVDLQTYLGIFGMKTFPLSKTNMGFCIAESAFYMQLAKRIGCLLKYAWFSDPSNDYLKYVLASYLISSVSQQNGARLLLSSSFATEAVAATEDDAPSTITASFTPKYTTFAQYVQKYCPAFQGRVQWNAQADNITDASASVWSGYSDATSGATTQHVTYAPTLQILGSFLAPYITQASGSSESFLGNAGLAWDGSCYVFNSPSEGSVSFQYPVMSGDQDYAEQTMRTCDEEAYGPRSSDVPQNLFSTRPHSSISADTRETVPDYQTSSHFSALSKPDILAIFSDKDLGLLSILLSAQASLVAENSSITSIPIQKLYATVCRLNKNSRSPLSSYFLRLLHRIVGLHTALRTSAQFNRDIDGDTATGARSTMSAELVAMDNTIAGILLNMIYVTVFLFESIQENVVITEDRPHASVESRHIFKQFVNAYQSISDALEISRDLQSKVTISVLPVLVNTLCRKRIEMVAQLETLRLSDTVSKLDIGSTLHKIRQFENTYGPCDFYNMLEEFKGVFMQIDAWFDAQDKVSALTDNLQLDERIKFLTSLKTVAKIFTHQLELLKLIQCCAFVYVRFLVFFGVHFQLKGFDEFQNLLLSSSVFSHYSKYEPGMSLSVHKFLREINSLRMHILPSDNHVLVSLLIRSKAARHHRLALQHLFLVKSYSYMIAINMDILDHAVENPLVNGNVDNLSALSKASSASLLAPKASVSDHVYPPFSFATPSTDPGVRGTAQKGCLYNCLHEQNVHTNYTAKDLVKLVHILRDEIWKMRREICIALNCLFTLYAEDTTNPSLITGIEELRSDFHFNSPFDFLPVLFFKTALADAKRREASNRSLVENFYVYMSDYMDSETLFGIYGSFSRFKVEHLHSKYLASLPSRLESSNSFVHASLYPYLRSRFYAGIELANSLRVLGFGYFKSSENTRTKYAHPVLPPQFQTDFDAFLKILAAPRTNLDSDCFRCRQSLLGRCYPHRTLSYLAVCTDSLYDKLLTHAQLNIEHQYVLRIHDFLFRPNMRQSDFLKRQSIIFQEAIKHADALKSGTFSLRTFTRLCPLARALFIAVNLPRIFHNNAGLVDKDSAHSEYPTMFADFLTALDETLNIIFRKNKFVYFCRGPLCLVPYLTPSEPGDPILPPDEATNTSRVSSFTASPILDGATTDQHLRGRRMRQRPRLLYSGIPRAQESTIVYEIRKYFAAAGHFVVRIFFCLLVLFTSLLLFGVLFNFYRDRMVSVLGAQIQLGELPILKGMYTIYSQFPSRSFNILSNSQYNDPEQIFQNFDSWPPLTTGNDMTFVEVDPTSSNSSSSFLCYVYEREYYKFLLRFTKTVLMHSGVSLHTNGFIKSMHTFFISVYLWFVTLFNVIIMKTFHIPSTFREGLYDDTNRVFMLNFSRNVTNDTSNRVVGKYIRNVATDFITYSNRSSFRNASDTQDSSADDTIIYTMARPYDAEALIVTRQDIFSHHSLTFVHPIKPDLTSLDEVSTTLIRNPFWTKKSSGNSVAGVIDTLQEYYSVLPFLIFPLAVKKIATKNFYTYMSPLLFLYDYNGKSLFENLYAELTTAEQTYSRSFLKSGEAESFRHLHPSKFLYSYLLIDSDVLRGKAVSPLSSVSQYFDPVLASSMPGRRKLIFPTAELAGAYSSLAQRNLFMHASTYLIPVDDYGVFIIFVISGATIISLFIHSIIFMRSFNLRFVQRIADEVLNDAIQDSGKRSVNSILRSKLFQKYGILKTNAAMVDTLRYIQRFSGENKRHPSYPKSSNDTDPHRSTIGTESIQREAFPSATDSKPDNEASAMGNSTPDIQHIMSTNMNQLYWCSGKHSGSPAVRPRPFGSSSNRFVFSRVLPTSMQRVSAAGSWHSWQTQFMRRQPDNNSITFESVFLSKKHAGLRQRDPTEPTRHTALLSMLNAARISINRSRRTKHRFKKHSPHNGSTTLWEAALGQKSQAMDLNVALLPNSSSSQQVTPHSQPKQLSAGGSSHHARFTLPSTTLNNSSSQHKFSYHLRDLRDSHSPTDDFISTTSSTFECKMETSKRYASFFVRHYISIMFLIFALIFSAAADDSQLTQCQSFNERVQLSHQEVKNISLFYFDTMRMVIEGTRYTLLGDHTSLRNWHRFQSSARDSLYHLAATEYSMLNISMRLQTILDAAQLSMENAISLTLLSSCPAWQFYEPFVEQRDSYARTSNYLISESLYEQDNLDNYKSIILSAVNASDQVLLTPTKRILYGGQDPSHLFTYGADGQSYAQTANASALSPQLCSAFFYELYHDTAFLSLNQSQTLPSFHDSPHRLDSSMQSIIEGAILNRPVVQSRLCEAASVEHQEACLDVILDVNESNNYNHIYGFDDLQQSLLQLGDVGNRLYEVVSLLDSTSGYNVARITTLIDSLSLVLLCTTFVAVYIISHDWKILGHKVIVISVGMFAILCFISLIIMGMTRTLRTILDATLYAPGRDTFSLYDVSYRAGLQLTGLYKYLTVVKQVNCNNEHEIISTLLKVLELTNVSKLYYADTVSAYHKDKLFSFLADTTGYCGINESTGDSFCENSMEYTVDIPDISSDFFYMLKYHTNMTYDSMLTNSVPDMEEQLNSFLGTDSRRVFMSLLTTDFKRVEAASDATTQDASIFFSVLNVWADLLDMYLQFVSNNQFTHPPPQLPCQAVSKPVLLVVVLLTVIIDLLLNRKFVYVQADGLLQDCEKLIGKHIVKPKFIVTLQRKREYGKSHYNLVSIQEVDDSCLYEGIRLRKTVAKRIYCSIKDITSIDPGLLLRCRPYFTTLIVYNDISVALPENSIAERSINLTTVSLLRDFEQLHNVDVFVSYITLVHPMFVCQDCLDEYIHDQIYLLAEIGKTMKSLLGVPAQSHPLLDPLPRGLLARRRLHDLHYWQKQTIEGQIFDSVSRRLLVQAIDAHATVAKQLPATGRRRFYFSDSVLTGAICANPFYTVPTSRQILSMRIPRFCKNEACMKEPIDKLIHQLPNMPIRHHRFENDIPAYEGSKQITQELKSSSSTADTLSRSFARKRLFRVQKLHDKRYKTLLPLIIQNEAGLDMRYYFEPVLEMSKEPESRLARILSAFPQGPLHKITLARSRNIFSCEQIFGLKQDRVYMQYMKLQKSYLILNGIFTWFVFALVFAMGVGYIASVVTSCRLYSNLMILSAVCSYSYKLSLIFMDTAMNIAKGVATGAHKATLQDIIPQFDAINFHIMNMCDGDKAISAMCNRQQVILTSLQGMQTTAKKVLVSAGPDDNFFLIIDTFVEYFNSYNSDLTALYSAISVETLDIWSYSRCCNVYSLLLVVCILLFLRQIIVWTINKQFIHVGAVASLLDRR